MEFDRASNDELTEYEEEGVEDDNSVDSKESARMPAGWPSFTTSPVLNLREHLKERAPQKDSTAAESSAEDAKEAELRTAFKKARLKNGNWAALRAVSKQLAKPTTKDVVLEERRDMLIEFQRLEEAIVEDMPKDLEGPTDDLVEVGLLESDRPVVREEEVQRIVEAAVAAALAGRDPISKGGGRKGCDSPASLRDVTRASVWRRLGWTWSECARVITEIKVAAARQAAGLARVKHAFGRHPAGRVEPWEFELVEDRFPACKQEQCGPEELHENRKVRTKHLYAYIDLALQEPASMQRALAGVPGIAQPLFDEEWAMAAATSRKRRTVRQPSGSDGEDSEGEERKRAATKARFGSLRTATDEELRRALDGNLAVKDITRPPGEIAAPAGPILPAGGALRGMDIRVSRPGGDYEEGGAEWRLDSKRGIVLEAKAKHCRTFDEWDEKFTVLMCKAPEEAGFATAFQKKKPQVPEPAQPDAGGAKPDKPGQAGKRRGEDRRSRSACDVREMQVEDAEPWWAQLRKMLVVPVWDAAGAPLLAAPVAAPAVPPAEELLEELAVAVERYQDGAYAESTQRTWDRPAKPVMSITSRDLAHMAEFADMETITGLALWAAILVGFYGLFRKDNLTVGKSQAWNARGALVREDVLFAEAGDVV
ncbi:hypothetical protein CYMTET_34836 [Cymbomonas tetramitiformis]|uniref:Uncharacterized protein n=1 Tax=Cymbomonas tetramitiformis TaxID=36881 RepID=A0AAE0KPJ7_9CHLO|nr:hypothetical protein CYMTET_34836 [Cymbomonas tetramitiformis]